jgi:hypothetical protein
MTLPTLLGLPRELRDEIYSYLSHDVTVNWPCCELLDLGYGLDSLNVKIHNAPLLSLLLAHPQIYHEHLAACTNALCGTIDMTLIPRVVTSHVDDDAVNERAPVLISLLRHLILFIHIIIAPQGTPQETRSIWTDIAAISAKLPHLQTLRVAFANPEAGEPVEHADIRLAYFTDKHSAAKRTKFLPSPPLSIAGLRLRQCGEGYRVMHGTCFPLRRADVASLYHPYVEVLPGEPYMLLHDVDRIGVYSFAQSSGEEVGLTREEVLRHWKVSAYPEEVVELLGAEGEDVKKWPMEVKEWREIRGDGVENWMDGAE